MMKNKTFWYKFGFTISGAITVFLYWELVGSASGSSLIKSVWYISALWATAMGYLFEDLTGSLILKMGAENDKTV
jgi:hypothetical protein